MAPRRSRTCQILLGVRSEPCSIRVHDRIARAIGQEEFPRDPALGYKFHHASSHGPARALHLAPPPPRAESPGSSSSWSRVPFAGRQTENLTGGGFETPGSRLDSSSPSARGDFRASQAEKLSVVFDNRAGDPAKLDAAIDRRASGEGRRGRAGGPELEQAAAAPACDEPIVMMPLSRHRRPRRDGRRRGRDAREPRHRARATSGRPIHLVGQSALWAGIQELSKEDLEQAEIIGLPIVLIVLLLVFGSLAAAALPLSLGVVARWSSPARSSSSSRRSTACRSS